MTTKKSISEKMKDLEAATEWFYSDDFTLEKATEKYKSTMKLAEEIEKDLNELKNEISVIEKDFTKE
ncbi:exodeoxyribonuclease VII small subunit [Candidatus Saccharibacteria bacterium]|nr:exodeoxyribonuclease VII small subunit [Candidatus Saccharibacteria bacterium]MBR2864422.1 exodeoxyribonuclease VII small subunit [Candidatus Saccharibacteria bacterium]MBR3233397.1 exodeoxyribonuclease VII small subunit [Candidatus Saccharibacteria bacterium]